MNESIAFGWREFVDLYARRDFEALSDKFLGFLNHFNGMLYQAPDAGTELAFNTFVVNFLYLFSQPDFVPSRKYAVEFIKQNQAIANLAAISPLKTTDAFLTNVLHQKNNLAKVLTLYSARNGTRLDRRAFFDADANLASIWYQAYAGICNSGLLSESVADNLKEHFNFQHPRLESAMNVNASYYGSTYVDGVCDRQIKPALNRCAQRDAAPLRVLNRPNPRKIAVVSSFWWPGHSSYRICSAYVEALQDYHVTLFHTPIPGRTVDASMFQEVKELPIVDSRMDISPLLDNEFSLAFFPDVGMTNESIMLANLRFAPIQVAGLGHSVSTFGAEIDYFISGADVEVPEEPERNYSERLILLPGCGAIHNRVQHARSGRHKTVTEFVLNCPWYAQKVNSRFVETLRELVRRSPRPLRFRLFVGSSLNGQGGYLPFARHLTAALAPAVVEILPNLDYKAYMDLMEEGDLTIDCYHFGGCNTVTDSLHLRKPMVTWQGDRWYNRIGSQMLRMAGLHELIATSEREYLEIILRLIQDDAHRAALADRVRQADLDHTIFSRADAPYFGKAISYLIANHDRLRREKDRRAIRIERE